MKKLQLNLEDLTVETFSAGDEGGPARGTVKGYREYTAYCNSEVPECNTSTCVDSEGYHCHETHNWDYGTCMPGSCLDSCDTFCGWAGDCY